VYGHWFDGDGCVSSLTFHAGGVAVATRLVETPRVKAQRAAGDRAGFPVRGAWTQASGGLWRNLLRLPSNPANTSMLRHNGRLLALCEGGAPVELDPVTLATRGEVPSLLGPATGFGAHFKVDPATGVLYNCGMQVPAGLRVFALAPDGRELAAAVLPFPGGETAFVHDFALSEHFLVFFIPPWTSAPGDAVAAVLGLRPIGHTFAWRQGRGTRCVVLRKADLSTVMDTEVPAFSSYHFANAFEADGLLHVHVCRLNGSRDALEANFSAMYSARWDPSHYNTLWEFRIDPAAGRVLGDGPVLPPDAGALPMEFPVISHRLVGHRHRFVYAAAFSGGGFFDALQKYDLVGGSLQTWRLPPGEFGGEPTFVPLPGGDAPEDAGFLLLPVYVAESHTGKLYVLDAADMAAAPLCVCALPTHLPYSFHGWFERA